MDSKNKFILDELDKKVLTELPLISEVLCATVNKVVRFFKPIHQGILEVCNSNLPYKWEIEEKKIRENSIYPFSEVEGRDKVTSLENFFQICNRIQIVKKDESNERKWLNYVTVEFGMYYQEEYEYSELPYFYFTLEKNPSKKFEGILYNLAYYQNIASKNSNLKINIYHPESGDETEYFEIMVPINSAEDVSQASQIFQLEILPDYLMGISKSSV
jgi:hypothetical protein